ncbi:MAG: pseudouridine synthase [Bilifractor sp.]|jgi:23S rRNA-/tRNA-specific pseudouridylate synthase
MIRILRETENYIAVRKPAGLATQSGRLGQMDLVNQVLNALAARQRRERRLKGETGASTAPYLAVINRLDQPVEGIVLFAKNPKAAAKLSEMLRNHEIRKEYLSVVYLTGDLERGGNVRSSANTDKGGNMYPAGNLERGGSIGPAGNLERGGSIGPAGNLERDRDIGAAGYEEANEGEWHQLSDYMIRDGRTNRSKIVGEGVSGAQRAVLKYRILKIYDADQTDGNLVRKQNVPDGADSSVGADRSAVVDRSAAAAGFTSADSSAVAGMKKALLVVDLETGRHHQIRLQLSHAGMPIVGDRKYGIESGRETRSTEGRRGERGDFPALCAFRLSFTDPWSREQTEIRVSPEGKNFADV